MSLLCPSADGICHYPRPGRRSTILRAFIVACAIAAATASLALPASASPPTTGAHVHPAVAAVSLGVPRGFTISDNATVLTSVQLYVAHHPGDFSGLWAEPPNSTLY